MKKCWNDFPLATSKKAWTTLQLIFDECLKVDGSNNYKLPHLAKEKWIREHGGADIPLCCTARYGGTAVPLSPQANTTTNNDSPMTVMAGHYLFGSGFFGFWVLEKKNFPEPCATSFLK
jgi:hypothetical protein